MKEQIEQLLAEVRNLTCKTEKDIEDARVRLLGKKGEITKLFDEFRTIAPELKREFGQKLNVLKKEAAAKIEELKANAQAAGQTADDSFDATLPGDIRDLGSRHPVSIARQQIVSIFRKFGYDVAEGPEIEDDYHVFEALNFPPNHPARDMQDTFFVSAGHPNPLLLRTHTSSVQVRAMEKMQLPIRVICPGRVFRNEAISARAHCIFHQVEGLYIDENVTFACNICHGKGRNICKGTGWLEILGCGMVDPNVLEASGIDSKKYSGFAFGMGIERIAMLKWQVNDLRHYFENDMRFLREFSSCVEV